MLLGYHEGSCDSVLWYSHTDRGEKRCDKIFLNIDAESRFNAVLRAK